MAYHFVFSFGIGEEYEKSTLYGQLYNEDNVVVGSPITAGFSYTGGGYFMLNNPNMPDNFRGIMQIYDAGTSEILTCLSINPQEGEYLDSKISSDNINIESGLKSTNIYVLKDQNLPVNDITITTGERNNSISNIKIKTGVR